MTEAQRQAYEELYYMTVELLDELDALKQKIVAQQAASEALWDLPPSYAYSYQWGDEVQSQIGRLYSMFNTLTGTYSVTGGGSVTVGASISNPTQSAPGQYTQAWGASVRLALNRLISNLQQICGASYRY